MSLRASIGFPVNCSGLMYGGVPRTIPCWVSFCSFLSSSFDRFAIPKSSTFTKSFDPARSVRTMLSGFKSRWTIPRPCASSSEPHTWFMIFSTRAGSIAPPFSSVSARFFPSTNSITM